METYSPDISNALQQHGHCLLPDIGLLYIVRNPASLSYQENKLYPPVHELSLIPLSGQEDKFYSIVQQIAFSHSLPVEEAALKWQEASIAIRQKLSTGSSVELPEIGLLNLDEDHQITLTAERSYMPVYQPVSLEEIKSFSFPKTGSNAPSPPADHLQIENERRKAKVLYLRHKKKRRREMASWWIAGTILALLVVGWLTYKGTVKRNEKLETVKKIIAKDTTKQLAKKDSIKLRDDSVIQRNAMLHDSIHYMIVFAIYHEKEKAIHQYHKMKGWGHPVVLIPKDSSVYELGMPFTTLRSDTTVSLVSMMKLYGDKVHIEYDSTRVK